MAETISNGGNILGNLDLIVPGTWQPARDVIRDWKEGAKGIGVNTAEEGLYEQSGGKYFFYQVPDVLFTDPMFRQRLFDGIVGNEFFYLPPDMREAVTLRRDMRIPYDEVKLHFQHNSRHGYVLAQEQNSPTEARYLQQAFGEHVRPGFRAYLLSPDDLRLDFEGHEQGLVARASSISPYGYFFPVDTHMIHDKGAIRGERR